MDQRVVSFDLQDKAEIELSQGRGGWPRVTVSAVSSLWAADGSHLVEQAVEFVHTCDSDPLVSLAFFRSLSDQARQAADELAGLISAAAGETAGTASAWDNPDWGVRRGGRR